MEEISKSYSIVVSAVRSREKGRWLRGLGKPGASRWSREGWSLLEGLEGALE